jgi:predicted Zn-dependent protease
MRQFITGVLAATAILTGSMSSPAGAQSIAKELEQQSAQAYAQLLSDAAHKGQLVAPTDPLVTRLRAIEQRLLPSALRVNERARQWDWQVNLIDSPQINAFCMPGGKIAFYTALINKLNLSDNEIAIVMGHEMTHALREHGVDQYKKHLYGQLAERAGVAIASQYFNINPQLLGTGAHYLDSLIQLRFSRKDEVEADSIGLEIAARSGFDPRAGITLWTKMDQAAGGAHLEFLSSHPGGPNRIHAIEAELPTVMPLYRASTH